MLRLNWVSIIIQRLIKLLFKNASEFSMFNVTSNTDGNLRDEYESEKYWESANHPWRLSEGTTTAEKAYDKNQRSDNHKEDGGCPKVFTDEIFIVLVAALYNCPDYDGKQTSKL